MHLTIRRYGIHLMTVGIDTSMDLELLLLEDEPACEASHIDDNPIYPAVPCSFKVVARKTVECEGDSFFICQNSLNWNLWYMSRFELCQCGRYVSECWEVRPI